MKESHPSSTPRKLKQENCFETKFKARQIVIPNNAKLVSKAKEDKPKKKGLANFLTLFSTLINTNTNIIKTASLLIFPWKYVH